MIQFIQGRSLSRLRKPRQVVFEESQTISWCMHIKKVSKKSLENTLFFMGYFPKIRMKIYSWDLPGRKYLIKWLINVWWWLEGEILEKNHSNYDHLEWWFQLDHEHQESQLSMWWLWWWSHQMWWDEHLWGPPIQTNIR